MTVKELIKKLEKLHSKDKEIVIRAENGLLFEPEIKIILNEEYNPASGIKKWIITY